jgi:tol-pal system protein YbgF
MAQTTSAPLPPIDTGKAAADAVKPAADAAVKVTKQAAKAAAATQGGGGSGDAGLKGRVESLEEQLVDMQVVVGTLESLAKSGGGAAPVQRISANGGADASRIESLETQVRSLSGQVQQLSDQVRSLGGTPRRSDNMAAPAAPAATPAAVAAAPATSSFGTTSVSTGGDAIGGLIDGAPLPPVPGASSGAPAAPGAAPTTTAALPPPADGATPKQLYETAYAYMLQRDYGAAEVSFDDFLKRFPSDSLAGNAQYWLGESYFVRGQYKAAAGAFLKGYQTYAQSAKAPDSLLKLAMSLDRLGQKDAACSSYSELSTKFPAAPQSVKARAQSERQRVGCP